MSASDTELTMELPVPREQVLAEVRAASDKVNALAAALEQSGQHLMQSVDMSKVEAVLDTVMDTLPEEEADTSNAANNRLIFEKCRGALDNETVDALIANEDLNSDLDAAMAEMQQLIDQNDLSEAELDALLG